jgi:2-polyprenyl-3-methyl-5-hydroxy-6-metoxy-1,4-benzoquinol methylase
MNCSICGKPSTRPYSCLNGFSIRTCDNCRFGQVVPTPSVSTLSEFYSGEETNIAKGNVLNEINAFRENPLQAIELLRSQRLNPLRILGEQFQDNNGLILDVGCGGGVFLAALKHLGYKNLHGIEYNPDSVRLIETNFGISVTHGAIEAIPSIPPANIATCFDVLEHVPDPQDSLVQLNRMLIDGGGLHIRVPNFGSLNAKIFRSRWLWAIPPYHLNYFTPNVLSHMIEQAGFKIVRTFTTGSGYRLAFLVLQLKRLLTKSIELPSPRSRAFSSRELLAINASEALLRLIQSPISLFCRVMDMDDCIHVVARKIRTC